MLTVQVTMPDPRVEHLVRELAAGPIPNWSPPPCLLVLNKVPHSIMFVVNLSMCPSVQFIAPRQLRTAERVPELTASMAMSGWRALHTAQAGMARRWTSLPRATAGMRL